MTHPSAQRRLDPAYDRLVEQYVESLPTKLAALEQAMTSGRAGDAAALAEAREIAHRMRGTAGCYGFRDLSEAAAVLEEVLRRISQGEGGTWTEADSAALLVRVVATGPDP